MLLGALCRTQAIVLTSCIVLAYDAHIRVSLTVDAQIHRCHCAAADAAAVLLFLLLLT